MFQLFAIVWKILFTHNAQFSGAERGAADCANMAKPCASCRGVFGVRWNALLCVKSHSIFLLRVASLALQPGYLSNRSYETNANE